MWYKDQKTFMSISGELQNKITTISLTELNSTTRLDNVKEVVLIGCDQYYSNNNMSKEGIINELKRLHDNGSFSLGGYVLLKYFNDSVYAIKLK